MKSMLEIVEMFGMSTVAESVDENGEVVSTASNPARGYSFYGVALKDVKGNPIEFASEKCDVDCFATTDEETLYIATRGTCSVGTKLK